MKVEDKSGGWGCLIVLLLIWVIISTDAYIDKMNARIKTLESQVQTLMKKQIKTPEPPIKVTIE